MSNDGNNLRVTSIASALFAAIFILIGWDLVADYDEGTGWEHLLVELAVLVAAALGLALLWRLLFLARSTMQALELDLSAAQESARRWRNDSRELIEGLGKAIESQFKKWNLTRAESEIGLLLLKGFSHKEAAALRQTSERTVREQARSLYRKAGLSGRSSLSAFFLEDLLLPLSNDPPRN
jgi:DNA-binding CsgD family transcriptional regulator